VLPLTRNDSGIRYLWSSTLRDAASSWGATCFGVSPPTDNRRIARRRRYQGRDRTQLLRKTRLSKHLGRKRRCNENASLPDCEATFRPDAPSHAAQRASLVGLRPYRAIALREFSCQARKQVAATQCGRMHPGEARDACIRQKSATPGESLIERAPPAEATPQRTAAAICAGDALTRVMHTPNLG
jgi:hypothetical protein